MKNVLNDYLMAQEVLDDGSNIIDLNDIRSREMISAYEYLKGFGFSLRKSKALIRNQYVISNGKVVSSLEELVEPTKIKVKLA